MVSFKSTWKWLLVLLGMFCLGQWCHAGESSGQLRMLETRHYTLRTDLDEDTAKTLGVHMDTVFDAYRSMFSNFKGRIDSRLEAYVFSTDQLYITFLRSEFGVDGTGSGGMFLHHGDRSVIAAWTGSRGMRSTRSILQHEGFHQFANVLFPDLPVWANEGFAELFGAGCMVTGEFWVGAIPASWLRRLKTARANDALIPFQDFFTMDSGSWSHHVTSGSASLNYTQAWSLAHFFLYAQDARWQKQFLSFLDLLNRGAAWEAAFRQVFGTSEYAMIQDAYLKWLDEARPVDHRAIIHELEILATGMFWLNQQGVYPNSLQSLWSQLKSRGFSFVSTLFSASRTLDPSDPVLLALPLGGTGDTPRIALADDRGDVFTGAAPGGNRPWNIRTVNLEPFDLIVEWTIPRKGTPTFRLWHE